METYYRCANVFTGYHKKIHKSLCQLYFNLTPYNNTEIFHIFLKYNIIFFFRSKGNCVIQHTTNVQHIEFPENSTPNPNPTSPCPLWLNNHGKLWYTCNRIWRRLCLELPKSQDPNWASAHLSEKDQLCFNHRIISWHGQGSRSLVKLTLFSNYSFVALLAAPVSALAEGLADSYRLQLPLFRHLPLKAAMLLTPVSRWMSYKIHALYWYLMVTN